MKLPLSKLAKIITGKTPPTEVSDYFGNDFPFITPSDIPSYKERILFNIERGLSEKGADFQKQLLIPSNSICFVGIGSTVGKMCVTNTDSFTNQQIHSLIPKTKMVNPQYLFYALRYINSWIKSIADARGSGKPIINKTDFSRFEIEVCDMPRQEKIAAILTAYDDLIENNNKRIKTLETITEEIYKEWFIRMRFPGYEAEEFSNDGIPTGWEVKPFSCLVEINPSTKCDKESKKPYVAMEDLSTSSMIFAHKSYRDGNNGTKFINQDVILPRITPCLENGKRGYVSNLQESEVGLGSTEFIVLRKKVLPSEFIYLLSCSSALRTHAELSMTGASGRQRVQPDCFDFFQIPVPPTPLLSQFLNVVQPIFQAIKILFDQNDNLVLTRDQLLARLLSGKMNVESLDIKFPPSMAIDRELVHA